LQFASVFFTEIAVEKQFDPPNVTSGVASEGASKNFLGSLSLAIF